MGQTNICLYGPNGNPGSGTEASSSGAKLLYVAGYSDTQRVFSLAFEWVS